jgi:hypothetical protein
VKNATLLTVEAIDLAVASFHYRPYKVLTKSLVGLALFILAPNVLGHGV